MKMSHLIPTVALAVSLITGCGKHDDHSGEKGHDHAKESKEAGHDGFLEVGEHVAHIKVDHDEKAGKLTLHIFDTSMKNAMKIKEAPVLNLFADKTKKQVKTAPVGGDAGGASAFEAVDDSLKDHPHGRILIMIKGTAYQVELVDNHDGHGGHEGHKDDDNNGQDDHKGHDHGDHEGHNH